MTQPTTLAGLSPREAVADAIHRCVLGLDNNDRALFESAMVKDEATSVTAGPRVLQGWNAINDEFVKVFSLVTTHYITNIRVNLEEDANTASMTTHATAYHIRSDEAYKPEDTSYTAGCLYFIDLVKDEADNLWKIKKWVIQVQWTTGDIAVVHP